MKVLIPHYLFSATTGTISALNYEEIKPEQLLLITNVSKNKIIYNFANSNAGAFVDSINNVIYLSADTSLMDDSDKLQIFIEDYFVPSSEASLTAVKVALDFSNTLLTELTSQQTTINLDVSSLNVNTDNVENLIFNTNSKLDVLTAVDYATKNNQNDTNSRLDVLTGVDFARSVKQDRTNTLLEELTAKNTTITLDVSAINVNTDEIEGKLDRTNTLLEELTAKNTTITLDVSAINVNTDEIEGKLDRTNTLLDNLTGNVLDIEALVNNIKGDTFWLPNITGTTQAIDTYTVLNFGQLAGIQNITAEIRNSLFNGIGGYTLGGYINNYNRLLSSIDVTLKNGLNVTGGGGGGTFTDAPVKKLASDTLVSVFTAPSAGRIYNIFGVSTANIGQYLQIYDVTGSTPSGTPSGIFYVPANSNFNFEFVKGMPFTNNKALIVNSITPVDYNGGNSDLFITVIYN